MTGTKTLHLVTDNDVAEEDVFSEKHVQEHFRTAEARTVSDMLDLIPEEARSGALVTVLSEAFKRGVDAACDIAQRQAEASTT